MKLTFLGTGAADVMREVFDDCTFGWGDKSIRRYSSTLLDDKFLFDCSIFTLGGLKLCNKDQSEIEHLLSEYGDDGKAPNPIAKGMSYIKTNVKLSIDGSDSAIAELITDGCNMGIKSLNKYLDQYKAADERSKDFAKKLIKMEEKLCRTVRNYIQ